MVLAAASQSDILLTYKDSVTIRQADLDTLREGYWLNDAVMSLYLDYLVDELTKNTVFAGKVHALDSVAANGMQFCDDEEDLVDMFGPLRLEECLAVVCPLNDSRTITGGGSHWAMLFIIRESLTSPLNCFVFDSAGEHINMLSVANGHLPKLATLMRGTKPNGGATAVTSFPLQGNSYDCGIFAICGAEAALTSVVQSGDFADSIQHINNGQCFTSNTFSV